MQVPLQIPLCYSFGGKFAARRAGARASPTFFTLLQVHISILKISNSKFLLVREAYQYGVVEGMCLFVQCTPIGVRFY